MSASEKDTQKQLKHEKKKLLHKDIRVKHQELLEAIHKANSNLVKTKFSDLEKSIQNLNNFNAENSAVGCSSTSSTSDASIYISDSSGCKGSLALLRAIDFCKKRPKIILFLLEKGMDPNSYYRGKNTSALWNAVANNLSSKIIKELINRGADVNFMSKIYRKTPLHLACHAGNKAIVDLLMHNGAHPEKRQVEQVGTGSISGEAPLHLAAANGHIRCIKLLQKSKRPFKINNIATCQGKPMTPLDYAIDNSHKRCAAYLRKNGALTANELDESHQQRLSNI